MPDLPTLAAAAQQLWDSALAIWRAGGPGMAAIAVVALVMFGVGAGIRLRLQAKGYASVPEKRWRQWIDAPDERRGPIGRILDEVDAARDVDELKQVFAGLHAVEIAPFQRDLKVMKVCVGIAPLVGLLGTVTGMLATFGALASGTGGEKTMAMISAGISEALITTETGLVVALPGLFFQYQLARRTERYKAFLAHLESVCMQLLYRRAHPDGAPAPVDPEVRRRLRTRLRAALQAA